MLCILCVCHWIVVVMLLSFSDCNKRRETAPDDESLPSENKSMAVEVILYKFKQPSPEASQK